MNYLLRTGIIVTLLTVFVTSGFITGKTYEKSIEQIFTQFLSSQKTSSDRGSTQGAKTSITQPPGFSPVLRVSDGDTIVVSIDGKDEKVRLIGVNTPESVDPRRKVECFGRESAQKLRAIIGNNGVRLEGDQTQTDRDRYGRLLRYVYLPNGIFVNLQLIQEGFAYEYTYNKPYKYQVQFREAQTNAANAKLGLWNENTCNGKL
jgi:micrococcal nuclease